MERRTYNNARDGATAQPVVAAEPHRRLAFSPGLGVLGPVVADAAVSSVYPQTHPKPERKSTLLSACI